MKMAERSRPVLFLLLTVPTLFQLVQGKFRDCENSLGMENGQIPDGNVVATVISYQNSPMFGAHHARLNSLSGYRADPSALGKDPSPYIWVQLSKEMIITGVATQGLGREWVTKYKMFFTSDDGSYVYFRDVDTLVKEFEGNVDGNTIKFNTVPYPTKTSQVLLVPTQWHKNIALRFELYGCEPGYYFKVWLKMRETTFSLSYMDLNDENTKYSEELVVNEVKEYLKDVPGFLFAKLQQFSPPLFIFDHQINQTSITAEMEIYCIESTAREIFSQLQNALKSQGDTPVLGNTILHVQNPANVKCQPPAMRISNISKHPFNSQVVLHDESNKRDTVIFLTSSLAPDCNISETLVYSWEIAFVDSDTGMLNLIFQFGKVDRGRKKTSKGKFWKSFINPPGLQYVRCIARTVDETGIHLLTYDFGFFRLVRKRPLECKEISNQRMPTFEKFTLRCNGGYKGVQATSYTATALNSSNQILNRSEWGSSIGSVNLPAGDGNGMEGYNVQVKVEAKYLSLPSLFDDVFVKVNILGKEVSRILKLLAEGNYVKAVHYLPNLQNILNQTKPDTTLSKKIKVNVTRGMLSINISSVQQLKKIARFVIFCNKEKTTTEIQNNSLRIVNMAVHFLKEKSAGNIPKISSITESLLEGVELILASTWEDVDRSRNIILAFSA